MDFAQEKDEIVRPEPARGKPSAGHVAELTSWPVDDVSEDSADDGGGKSHTKNDLRTSPDKHDENDENDENDTNDENNEKDDPGMIDRHDPPWEVRNDDEIDDDYHAFMRKV